MLHSYSDKLGFKPEHIQMVQGVFSFAVAVKHIAVASSQQRNLTHAICGRKQNRTELNGIRFMQHSAAVQVAALHVFEVGLSSKTSGNTQPGNPSHVGAGKKERFFS